MKSFETHSEEETIELGRKIARELPQKAVVLLIGNLGAGKTTLAKGIISGLGAAEARGSHQSDLHPDPRIRAEAASITSTCTGWTRPQQVATLGLEEIFDREAVVLIEWGERFPDLFPAGRIEIRLQPLSESIRQITINQ